MHYKEMIRKGELLHANMLYIELMCTPFWRFIKRRRLKKAIENFSNPEKSLTNFL